MIELDILNKTICIVAKRNSGKSNLIRYLVDSNKGQFMKIFVISPTEKVNHFYNSIVPENQVFDQWNENWANKLIDKMSELNANKSKEERKNILLIMDDCFSDTNFHSSQTLKKIFSRGRHVNISCIAIIQKLTMSPPLIRANCDFLLCGQQNRSSIMILCDEFMSGDIDKREFMSMYNRVTKDYGFLVINNNSIKDNDDLNQIYGMIKTPQNYIT